MEWSIGHSSMHKKKKANEGFTMQSNRAKLMLPM